MHAQVKNILMDMFKFFLELLLAFLLFIIKKKYLEKNQ